MENNLVEYLIENGDPNDSYSFIIYDNKDEGCDTLLKISLSEKSFYKITDILDYRCSDGEGKFRYKFFIYCDRDKFLENFSKSLNVSMIMKFNNNDDIKYSFNAIYNDEEIIIKDNFVKKLFKLTANNLGIDFEQEIKRVVDTVISVCKDELLKYELLDKKTNEIERRRYKNIRYEYTWVYFGGRRSYIDDNELNSYGKDGREAVSVIELNDCFACLMKREY